MKNYKVNDLTLLRYFTACKQGEFDENYRLKADKIKTDLVDEFSRWIEVVAKDVEEEIFFHND